MADNGGGGVAGCCCSFIFTSGLTVLFMWLSLRTNKPTCSIERFYVPALNRSQNSSSNHSISFDLKLKNNMKDKGVQYGPINLTFSYSQIPVATDALQGFYQGHGKTANRKNRAVAAAGVPWEAAVDAVSNGSTVLFRVDLATWVRYKILFWHTKRERVAVGGNVTVGSSGEKEGKKKKKGVKLNSKSPDEIRPGHYWVRVGLVGCFHFLAFLM